jgi:hypothetical protein
MFLPFRERLRELICEHTPQSSSICKSSGRTSARIRRTTRELLRKKACHPCLFVRATQWHACWVRSCCYIRMATFQQRSRQSVRPAIDGLQSLCFAVRLPLSPRRCPALPDDDEPCMLLGKKKKKRTTCLFLFLLDVWWVMTLLLMVVLPWITPACLELPAAYVLI